MTEVPDIPADYRVGEWLAATGPDGDVAVCTRVRFARNVQGYRFATSLGSDEATTLKTFLCQELHQAFDELRVVDLAELDELDRELLIERHLISRELAERESARAALVNEPESVSIMINEEDHLRTQVFRSGFQVDAAVAEAVEMDSKILETVPLAFSEEFGFLTSCPTNAGTGLRVSVMLHVPGLVWAGEMERAAYAAQKIHHAVRGLYGEGSRAVGDFYQVSNQVTLGRDEDRIASDVRAAVTRLVSWEREVRTALLDGEAKSRTTDRIHRALGTLENARILTSEECLQNLSAVRFGVQSGILPPIDDRRLNLMLLLTQPAHLQRIFGERLGPTERDARRAVIVRSLLDRANGSPSDDPS